MTIKETLQSFHNQSIDFYTLMREILAYQNWILASQNDQPLLLKNDDKTFLLLYSDLDCFEKQNGNSIQHITKNGSWIIENLTEPISAAIIDPNEDHAVQLDQKYFPVLNKLRKSKLVEEILQGSDLKPQALQQLQQFNHFLIPIIQDSNGVTHITLAPDDQGRKLAAIFTSEDCLQAFVTASKHLLGEDIKIDEISGTQLFQNLSQVPIDGVVFNCNGPVTPRALSKEFVSLLAKQL